MRIHREQLYLQELEGHLAQEGAEERGGVGDGTAMWQSRPGREGQKGRLTEECTHVYHTHSRGERGGGWLHLYLEMQQIQMHPHAHALSHPRVTLPRAQSICLLGAPRYIY